MKLLITGIPGTGKTTIGQYLEEKHGFRHFDIEAALKAYGREGAEGMTSAFLDAPGEDKVITWGFLPVEDAPLVRQFQALGYTMIWFDGDREAARREFSKREVNDLPNALHAFDNQMTKIDAMDLASFKPIRINPFGKDGKFLPKEERVRMIFESINM